MIDGISKMVENVDSGGPRLVDHHAVRMQFSKSGAALGRPGRLHGAYGMVIDREQGVTPSGRERVIRGLDPGTLPVDSPG